jgi:hypothetical protein
MPLFFVKAMHAGRRNLAQSSTEKESPQSCGLLALLEQLLRERSVE